MRMADGPVNNLPAGMDAYGGYVNNSGIGITYPGVLAKFPNAKHLSFTTDGSQAMCADVEKGAMNSWAGYDYGYASISRVAGLIQQFGRPKKLLTAHQDPLFGSHICDEHCWPGLPKGFKADGTQWINHGGLWDESLLADDFFIIDGKEQKMDLAIGVNPKTGNLIVICKAADNGNLLYFEQVNSADAGTKPGSWSVTDVTDNIGTGQRAYRPA